MKCNMGKVDRTFRTILGIAIIAYGVYLKTWWGAIGIVPVITGLTGWCPVYIPFRISTKKAD